MLISIVLVLFFALLLVGVPIYLVLSGLALLVWLVEGQPLVALGQQYANHLNSYTLVAIPLFVIAATFMQRGGVARALIEMAAAWVGRTRGALGGIVCVLATAVFAAISGSSVATALAIGAVLIPRDERAWLSDQLRQRDSRGRGHLGDFDPAKPRDVDLRDYRR